MSLVCVYVVPPFCLSGPPHNAQAKTAKQNRCQVVCIQPNVFDEGTLGLWFYLYFSTFHLFFLKVSVSGNLSEAKINK